MGSWKGCKLKMDDSSGALVELTAQTNQFQLDGSQEALDDTTLNDDEYSYDFGLAGATFSGNIFANSTTDAIFGPLMGNRTTATKTTRYFDKNRWYSGEALITKVSKAGAPNTLQAWAISGNFDGAIGSATA